MRVDSLDASFRQRLRYQCLVKGLPCVQIPMRIGFNPMLGSAFHHLAMLFDGRLCNSTGTTYKFMTLRKLFVLLLCALLVAATPPRPVKGGAPWTRSEIVRLRRTIARLLSAPALRGAQVGLLAIDTVRHTQLYALNADQEFMPASNFKLLVGSAALRTLGPNFTYVTTVLADAQPVNGTIAGNLYLRGGGDALLKAADLDAAAAALAAAGVKRVDGALITDASHDDKQRLGFGWSWDDLPYYYAPVVTALELEDGVVHVHMVPGETQGAPVSLRIDPRSDAFTIDDRLVTGAPDSKDTSDIVRPWDEPRTIELVGSYPLGVKVSGDLAPSVPDPESYAGDVFVRALAAHGVTVADGVHAGVAPARRFVLWSHDSEPMPKLMADFWYPSDNLMGELFLKELGVVEGAEPGTDAKGRALEQRYLRSIGVDPTTVSIADGSGLSQYDRITPRDLLMILQNDWNAPYRDIVLDALPLAGVRGTLKQSYLGTPAERRVFAKTGSISHVRTISGFIQTRTHGPVTFSLLVNQWMGEDEPNGPAALAKVRGAVLSAIAGQ
jgi:D-alanyl-D-alanine carboxypeptidase/D-alanyl-D-alanine-endopeptidase (penicillin-binding protein 4)